MPKLKLNNGKKIRLKLEKKSWGALRLLAVDEDSVPIAGANILTIGADGKLRLHTHIDDSIGLTLTEQGAIELA